MKIQIDVLDPEIARDLDLRGVKKRASMYIKNIESQLPERIELSTFRTIVQCLLATTVAQRDLIIRSK